jgi:GMP synthase (glutamine-hydrolysing)
MGEIHDAYDTILILDFGSQVRFLPPSRSNLIVLQYSHLITRRCRELNVYAELMPCTQKIKDLSWKPKGKPCSSLKWLTRTHSHTGVILSGSPYSVYDDNAPHVDPDVFDLGVPILGICYGLQVCFRSPPAFGRVLTLYGEKGASICVRGEGSRMRSSRIRVCTSRSH